MSDREVSIECDGKPIGRITVTLEEQQAIAGVDNAIVVLGNCENLQDGSHNGFVMSVIKNVIKPESAAIVEGVNV